jgi:hypothetical protein
LGFNPVLFLKCNKSAAERMNSKNKDVAGAQQKFMVAFFKYHAMEAIYQLFP